MAHGHRDEKHTVPSNPDFAFVELPVISRVSSPLRPLIDGEMASGIKTPHILQGTLTIYGDIRRVTEPLGIATTTAISVLALDGERAVHWSGTGGYSAAASNQLEAVLGYLVNSGCSAPVITVDR